MKWADLVPILVIAIAALGLLVMFLVEERAERRQRAIEERRRQIVSDAIRVKALLDQEAFRAARRLTEAANRSRR